MVNLFPKKEKRTLLLDIGTSAVKALIFKKSEEKIVILKKSVQEFEQAGVFEGLDFKKEGIERVIKEVLQNWKGEVRMVSNVFLSLPANVFRGRIFLQSLDRKNFQKIIDKKEEKEIYQKVDNLARKKVYDEFFQESDVSLKDIYFSGWQILERKIDGYETAKLEGYEGRILELKVLLNFLPQKYLKFIEDIVKACGLKNVNLAHPVQGLFTFFKEKSEGIFLDVGGQATQIFLKRREKLEKIDELEMGGENFSQILAYTLGMKLAESRALKESYCHKKVGEGVRRRIREVLLPAIEDWFQNLKWKLKSYKILLPGQFFLFGGGSLLPEIEEILERGNWNDVSFSSLPEVKLIYPQDIPNLIDLTHKLHSPQDTSSILLCPYDEFIQKIF